MHVKLLLCLFCASVALPVSAQENSFLARSTVRAYINEIVEQHNLDPIKLANVFAEIEPQQSILVIKQKRIDAGRAFMQTHAQTLAKAEETFGVPASIIAAIIGVETFYGKITGKHGVLESVATLAFDYPPRSKFFKSELTQFLILSQEENWDALAIKGSYAGAVGWPQFISSSYRAYAIDFDGDGRRDLFNSIDDVIGSVANYLNEHGWRTGQPIAEPLLVSAKQRKSVQALQRKSLKPAVAPKTLKNLGFNVAGKKPVSVMNLQGKGGEEAWVGYTNFYVITRYNHSSMYALAVYQLSQLLDDQSAN